MLLIMMKIYLLVVVVVSKPTVQLHLLAQLHVHLLLVVMVMRSP